MTSELAKQVAAAVILLSIGLTVFAVAVLLWRVEYSVLVNHVLVPLGISAALIFALSNYVAMKVLWGKNRTESSLATILDIAKKAGAADELRKQVNNGERRDDDN